VTKGLTKKATARRLGLDRKTVAKYLGKDQLMILEKPRYQRRPQTNRSLREVYPQIVWMNGLSWLRSGSIREIKVKGYTGSKRTSTPLC